MLCFLVLELKSIEPGLHPYFSTQQIRVTQKAFKRTKMCIGEESSITWNIKTIESLYVINTPPTYLI